MGQVLEKLAGRPYIDVETETSDTSVQTAVSHILVQDAECPICKQETDDHYICCEFGHGACWSCLMTVIADTQPLCPHCRRQFLPALIPNSAFNCAIREARKRGPLPAPVPPPPPPPIQLTVAVTSRGRSHPTTPHVKRARDPEEEQTARRRRVERLAASASALTE